MGQRRQTQTDAMEVEAGLSDPASLLGLPSTGQAELLAKMLPSCLDLMLVGLELDHWTSLVAGAADSGECQIIAAAVANNRPSAL